MTATRGCKADGVAVGRLLLLASLLVGVRDVEGDEEEKEEGTGVDAVEGATTAFSWGSSGC